MYALVLGNEKIDGIDIERVQERDIDLIVRPRHCAEPGLQIGLGRLAYPVELFEFPNLAEGDGAAPEIAVTAYVVGGALMDEDPDTVLGTQLLQSRELRINFALVF
jgi:hypothetical protein